MNHSKTELNLGTTSARSSGHRDDVGLLGEIWDCWLHAGQQMPTIKWATPSGLGDWTVRELYAHVARGVSGLADLVAESPVRGEPDLSDAAAYFAVLMSRGADGARHVADTTRQFAAARSTAELVGAFDGLAVAALAGANTAAASVVPTIAGTMRIIDYVLTRVLEATVHLLDLHHATPGVSPPPDRALRRTADVLTDLTPAADFIRLATGRSHAPVFPVLT
jgi:hypothetical protein